MTHLSVNLNAIAYVRNRRDLPWPSVTEMAQIALEAGASGITVHPRPDERHIRRTDVFELDSLIRGKWPGREYNIEGFPDEALLALCERVRPDQATLVPDEPSQATSDHGWDFGRNGPRLAEVTARLRRQGIRVSLFVDPDPAVAAMAARTGAERVELFTGAYGHPGGDKAAELRTLKATAEACRAAGLGVNAGHDLTLDNLPALVAAIPDLMECSIGHALTADALKYGLGEAVRRYRQALTGQQ